MVEPPVRRASRGPTWPVAGLVALLCVLIPFASTKIPADHGGRSIDALGIAFGVVGALAILAWRRAPVAMLVVTSASMFAYTAMGYPGGPALLPGPLMLAFLGYEAPKRTAWIGAAAVVAADTGGRAIAGESLGTGELVVIGWALAMVLAGQAVRTRNDRVAAERVRRLQVERQALADERLRIAQDLHDSVAHAMATITVQSGVAAHLLDRNPDQAREALEAIRVASADALDELAAILGVLRDPDDAAPRAPAGRLTDVAGLVERARADGLPVTLHESGGLERVPVPVGAAAYRVVQEALTNVRRHAGGGATAAVEVDADEHGVAVSVTDDGGRVPVPAGPNSEGAGLGLVGMRERVESTGGTLTVGPRAGGGFAVRARWDGSR